MKRKIKLIMIAIIAILVIFAVIAKCINLREIILKNMYPKKYEEYVEKYAAQNNIDPLLIFSIIKAESNFNENALSASEAKGLMQLMNTTATEVANRISQEMTDNEDLYNPETNIKIGVNYYSYLLDLYDGNMLLALTAYNAGIGNVNKWIENGIIKKDGTDIENIPYKETNMYVRKIINNYKMYQNLYK